MADSERSQVKLSGSDDPAMERAYSAARTTFRYFWRELRWERRRIVPALSMAAVKAPFSDGARTVKSKDRPDVEHIWIDEVNFDGREVTGKLLNAPNWLKTVKVGDEARLPLDQISDWMYVIDDKAYGAFTVHLLRSRMSPQELQEHDESWGLSFGNPFHIRGVPGPDSTEVPEHPISEGGAQGLRDYIRKHPNSIHERDDDGWTSLHHEALAGNLLMVQTLLDAGVDRKAVTDHGMTPLDLARTLNWEKVIAALSE